MGQARQRKLNTPNGNQSVSKLEHSGILDPLAPPTNRGVKSDTKVGEVSNENNQNDTNRCRVNLTLPPGVYRALSAAAENMGTTVSSLSVSAILAGLPTIAVQVESLASLCLVAKLPSGDHERSERHGGSGA